MNDIDALREEIRRERERNERDRERIDRLERRIDGMETVSNRLLRFIQGDAELLEKGAAARMMDLTEFMATMKGFDFAEMKGFVSEYKDLKKRALTVSAVLTALTGGVWLIIANMDKIAKLIHH
jgi:phosphoserine phosphatase